MTKKTIVSIIALLAMALPAGAQLRSVGEVPADLKMSVQELYDTDLQRAKEYVGGRVRDRQQLLEASYNINKMLSGGHIVYGDPISAMVSRIADTLLRDYPELRSELRFYTVTSSDVNAYTTPQGMVFVNTGLVAQVENEAQLAFIIAHEIVHYYRSHSMEELVGKKARKRGDNLDDEAERRGDFLRYHSRSREMENEADSLGIAMFYLGSPYAKDVTEGVFDVLQYSELPFDEIAFDTTWFNTPYYTVEGCWLAEVADITSRDNYDDSHSTHPNILSRRQRTAAALDGYYGGERYVVTTKEEFAALQRMARLECIRQDLLHGNYAKAFYNSWVMGVESGERRTESGERRTESGERRAESGERRTESGELLDRYMVQALYGMATFKNNDKQGDVTVDYKKVQGESQQVHYALKTMSKEQLTLAALHQAWEAHLRHPQDESYTAVAADLMEQLRTKVGKASPDYLPTPPEERRVESGERRVESGERRVENGERRVESGERRVENGERRVESEEPKTKYERIKQKRQTQTQRTPTAYALTDLMMQDATLQPTLRDHLNNNAKRPAATDVTKDTAAMLVFNPSYWVVDSRKDQMLINKSISQEDALGHRIERMAERFGHRAVDFSDRGMHGMSDAEQYNDFLTICEWMNEFWLSKGKFEMTRVMQPAMNELLDRYGARTLNMTALMNTEHQKGAGSIGYAVILPLAPAVIASSMSEREHTTMVSLMIDAREGKMMTRQVYNGNVTDANSMVDAMLYDTYRKAMNPLKKEPVGHMGHRMAITGGMNIGPSGKQPMKQLKEYVAFTPWAALEFAINRKTSLFASARYHKAYEGVSKTVGHETYDQYGTWTGYVEENIPSSMDMLTISAGGRFYGESEFAPMGRYISAEVLMTHYTMPFENGTQESDNTFGIGLGMGQNFVFFNRLVLNYEVNYAWSFGYLTSKMKNFGNYYDDNVKTHRADGLYSNLLTLRVGLGVIPF